MIKFSKKIFAMLILGANLASNCSFVFAGGDPDEEVSSSVSSADFSCGQSDSSLDSSSQESRAFKEVKISDDSCKGEKRLKHFAAGSSLAESKKEKLPPHPFVDSDKSPDITDIPRSCFATSQRQVFAPLSYQANMLVVAPPIFPVPNSGKINIIISRTSKRIEIPPRSPVSRVTYQRNALVKKLSFAERFYIYLATSLIYVLARKLPYVQNFRFDGILSYDTRRDAFNRFIGILPTRIYNADNSELLFDLSKDLEKFSSFSNKIKHFYECLMNKLMLKPYSIRFADITDLSLKSYISFTDIRGGQHLFQMPWLIGRAEYLADFISAKYNRLKAPSSLIVSSKDICGIIERG